MQGKLRTLKTWLACMAAATAGAAMAVPLVTGGPMAQAATSEGTAYATLAVAKQYDGTGYAKDDAGEYLRNADGSYRTVKGEHTFITSANGFKPADDTPFDGVVASGDSVGYTVRIDFKAAGGRSVDVRFDTSQAPYLTTTDIAAFCQSGKEASAEKLDENTCRFTIKAGAVESIDRSIRFVGKDTGGTAKAGQQLRFTVWRDGKESFEQPSHVYLTDPLTVVSAPAADLVIDNGGHPSNRYSIERRAQFTAATKDTDDLTGYFGLKVLPLRWSDRWSTNGASVSGPWAGKVDVSAFPAGTVWTFDGKQLPVASDGTVAIPAGQSGDKRLDWSFKAGAVRDKVKDPGTSTSFDIRVIPNDDVFANGGESAYLNNGKGGEPGLGKDRSYATRDAATGATSGYPYPNNDWSRAMVTHPAQTPPPGMFDKSLYVPYTGGQTKFDEGSMSFGKADSSAQVDHYDNDDKVARKTEVVTSLIADTRNSNDTCAEKNACSVVLMDVVGNTAEQTYAGHLDVSFKGAALDPSAYTAEWTDDDPGTVGRPKTEGVVWTKGEPKAGQAFKAIRVTVAKPAIAFGATDGGIVDVRFRMATTGVSTGSEAAGNIQVEDYGHLDYLIDGKVNASLDPTDYVIEIDPGDPHVAIDYSVVVHDTDTGAARDDGKGNKTDAYPGDTETWTAKPSVGNIAKSGTAIRPVVCLSKPAGIRSDTIEILSPQWRQTTSDKCGADDIAVAYASADGSLVPGLDRDGDVTLPDVVWRALVSNKAAGVQTSQATLHLDVDATTVTPAHPDMTASDNDQFNVSNASSTSGYMKADQEKVEITDPLSFDFNVYAKGNRFRQCDPAKDVANGACLTDGRVDTAKSVDTGQKHDGDMVTVIRMPDGGDKDMLGESYTDDEGHTYHHGLDGTWYEYDRGSSAIHGSYRLAEDVNKSLVADNSTKTVITYAVAWHGYDADDKGYAWKTWDQLTDADKANVKALRVTSAFETADGDQPIAAATATVRLQPTNNREGDQYNLWLGNNTFTDGSYRGNLPWADRTKVVASTVSGTLWWDENDDARMDKDEPRVVNDDGHGITVNLYKRNDKGEYLVRGADGLDVVSATKRPYDTMTTWKDAKSATVSHDGKTESGWEGGYRFTSLHSGSYYTEIARNGSDDTSAGSVPHKTKAKDDYYAKQRDIANTYVYGNRTFDGAEAQNDGETATHSTDIALGMDTGLEHVDYGFFRPSYKLSLNKQVSGTSCDGLDCTVRWAVTVKNEGNATVRKDGSRLTDVMDANVTDVTSALNPMKSGDARVYTSGLTTLVLDRTSGVLYAWGDNTFGQTGVDNANNTVPFVQGPHAIGGHRFVSAAAGKDNSAAIDEDGDVWIWGHMAGPAASGSATPTKVTGLSGKATKLAFSDGLGYDNDNLLILTDTGVLYSTNGTSATRTAQDVVDVSAFGGNAVGSIENNYVYVQRNGTVVGNMGLWTSSNASVWGTRFSDWGSITDVRQIAMGATDVTVLHNDGTITTYGLDDDFGQKARFPGNDWVAVAAGRQTVFGVKRDGSVWAVGRNNQGQLGIGSIADDGRAYTPNGTYAADPTGSKVTTPTDTGITVPVSDKDGADNTALVASGEGYTVFAGKTIRTAGVDAFGRNVGDQVDLTAGSTYRAFKPQATVSTVQGLRVGDVVDASTSQPIDTPAGVTANGLTSREYQLPYDLPAGQSATFVFTGHIAKNAAVASYGKVMVKADGSKTFVDAAGKPTNVMADIAPCDAGTESDPTKCLAWKYTPGADKYIPNQAWITTDDTPYDATPAQRLDTHATTPANPPNADALAKATDRSKLWDESSNDLIGIPSCVSGADAGGEDKEHLFDLAKGPEDQCDQVAIRLPGQTRDVSLGDRLTGSISGVYWMDENRNGIRDDAESGPYAGKEAPIAGQAVTLYTGYGTDAQAKVAETTTDAKGAYTFAGLPIDQDCAVSDGNDGMVKGMIVHCSSKAYTVVFSAVTESDGHALGFTKPDMAAGDADHYVNYKGEQVSYGDTGDRNSNAAVAGDHASTVTVTWDKVDADQAKAHIDAGVVPDINPVGSLPTTGRLMPFVYFMVAFMAVMATMAWRAMRKGDAL